jgi:hypothetical protein
MSDSSLWLRGMCYFTLVSEGVRVVISSLYLNSHIRGNNCV